MNKRIILGSIYFDKKYTEIIKTIKLIIDVLV